MPGSLGSPDDTLTPARRRWLLGALALGLAPAVAADSREAARSSHFPFGPVVPPRPLPAWPLKTHLDAATDLAQLLRGKVSAVQLMFTGCSATCPIQGALFAQAQRELGRSIGGAQFVSLSIDALSDTPAALQAWLRKFGAAPGWLAAVPRVADVDPMIDRLGSGGENRPRGSDPHTGQVYVVDRRGALVYRTPSLPTPAQIVEALRLVDGRG